MISFCGFFFYRYQFSKPIYKGNIYSAQVSESVEVLFDQEGIPHLTANNEKDALYALGRLMAQERLFQMDIMRRLSQGKLSEVFGKKMLNVDKLFRTLGFKNFILKQKSKGLIDEIAWSKLEIFYKGVNDHILEQTLPIEFAILGYSPELFSPLDAYTFLGYMGYSFGIGWKSDLLFSELKKILSKEQWEKLRYFPSFLGNKATAFIERTMTHGVLEDVFKMTESYLGVFEGSNAWAVSSKLAKNKSPLLASDPHLSFTSPGIWYEAHLKYIDHNIYGYYLPLIPFATLGHDDRKAWGVTISYIDDMDFFEGDFNKENLTGRFNGETFQVEKYVEKIVVRGGADVDLAVYHSPYGPLLDSVLEQKGLFLSWTYYHESNQSMKGLMMIEKAKDFNQFQDAVSKGTSPGLNIVYADKEGNIARLIHGLYPVRKDEQKNDQILNSSDGYLGYVEYKDRPHLINPPENYIVSANWRPEGSGRLSGYYQPSDRYDTISSILEKRQDWTIDDFKQIQTLSGDVHTKWLLLTLIKDVYQRANQEQKDYLDEMNNNWDLLYGKESKYAAFFHQWIYGVMKNALDEMDEKTFLKYCRISASWNFLKNIMRKSDDQWWDKKITNKVELRSDIIFEVFNQLFPNRNQYNWGQLHQLTFEHPLGKIPFLGKLFNFGPFPVSGAYNQVNNMRHVGCEEGWRAKAGPSTRRLIDLSDTSKSLGILPMGNSGHIASPYYSNQVNRFLDGKYRDVLFKKIDSKEVLRIVPK